MNRIVSFCTVFLLLTSVSFSQKIKVDEIEEVMPIWQNNFKEALKKSKAEKKPVLIFFTGSDWCKPCKVLDKELFASKEFKNIADNNLILYKADYPSNIDLISPETLAINNDLKKKYKVNSFPTLLFVNHKGKVIDYKKGMYLTEYYYPFINSVIQKYH